MGIGKILVKRGLKNFSMCYSIHKFCEDSDFHLDKGQAEVVRCVRDQTHLNGVAVKNLDINQC